ncbi:MAG: hypothetical protein BWY66_00976 [bacterium ADurb.Bin374]|nr:MAG: hypothetical protein BWY66_00976 [bacterium ADurb.Bin374]
MQPHQPFDRVDRCRFRSEGFVLGDQITNVPIQRGSKNRPNARQPEPFDAGAGLAGEPRLVGRERGNDLIPFGRRQGGLFPKSRQDDEAVEGFNRLCPGRVDRIVQRKRPAGFDPGQRQIGKFGTSRRQQSDRHLFVVLFRTVEVPRRAGIERSQPAAREKIVDLRPDGGKCGIGRHRISPVGKNCRIRFTRPPPGIIRPARVDEGVESRLVDPGNPAPVIDTANAGDDLLDHLPPRLISRRGRRNDAIAVEARRGESLRRIRHVGHGDRLCVRFAEPGQNAASRCYEPLSLLIRVVDRSQRQGLGAFQKIVGILQPAADPLDRGQNFRHANTPILVGIDQGEGRGVQFESLHRATQGHPQLGIEIPQRCEIGSRVETDLVHAAGAEKSPGVPFFRGFLSFGHTHVFSSLVIFL